MTGKQRKWRTDRPEAKDRAEQQAAQWVIEKVGDLGSSHDLLAKHDMLDAYCEEQRPPERY